MNYLHYEFDAGPQDVIAVTLDHPANVQLLDPSGYENYQKRREFKYRGGYVDRSPFHFTPPRQGRWHVVVDLGGYSGSVRASARVLPANGDHRASRPGVTALLNSAALLS